MSVPYTIAETDQRCVCELECPNSHYSRPRLTELQSIPDHVRATLDALWQRSVHQGRKVRFFRHSDVFVAQEGLVFDQDLSLVRDSITYHSEQEIRVALDRVRSATELGTSPTVKQAILTKSRGADNYGHFVLEMLPRAWLARKTLGLGDWPALIHDTNPFLSKVMREALGCAGFADEALVSTSAEPTLVRELIIVDGLTSHSQYMSPFVMTALDEIASSAEAGSSRNVYATRGEAVTRDFTDRDAVRSEMKALGFSDIFTGEMSFREQVSLFKGADVVAGVAGAALSNMAFCRPGAEVHCFMPSTALEVFFWMIAERRNLRYHEVRCQESGPQLGPLPWDRSISLPDEYLRNLFGR